MAFTQAPLLSNSVVSKQINSASKNNFSQPQVRNAAVKPSAVMSASNKSASFGIPNAPSKIFKAEPVSFKSSVQPKAEANQFSSVIQDKSLASKVDLKAFNPVKQVSKNVSYNQPIAAQLGSSQAGPSQGSYFSDIANNFQQLASKVLPKPAPVAFASSQSYYGARGGARSAVVMMAKPDGGDDEITHIEPRVAESLIKEMTDAERKEFNELPSLELDDME